MFFADDAVRFNGWELLVIVAIVIVVVFVARRF